MPTVLRPSAPAYVPLAKRTGAQEMRSSELAIDALSLTDLPASVTSLVLSKLTGYADAVNTALTSRALRAEVAEAPLSLSFGSKASSALPSAEVAARISQACKAMPGVTSLDLSSLNVEDAHVLHLCGSLRRLRDLNLSGCKKLTSRLCDAMARQAARPAAAPSPSPPPAAAGPGSHPLLALDLQRCFQLNSVSLAGMLRACADPACLIRLQFLAMSHLDLASLDLSFPAAALDADGFLPSPAPVDCGNLSGSSSSLRMLALHNCTRLTAPALLSVAASCPKLSVLLLGGSSFAPASLLDASATGLSEQLQRLAPNQHAPMRAWQLVCDVRAAVDTCPMLLTCKGSASLLEHMASMAVILTTTALVLPDLQALELTFLPQPVVAAVRHALHAVCGAGGGGGRHPPDVWDLTQEAGVDAALRLLHAARHTDVLGAGGAEAAQRHVALALRCAVNCSSSARMTPLHAAACGRSCSAYDGGAARMAERLLKLGAMADARDVAGASAMFLAAEAGQAAVVRRLLAAGADSSLSNAAGESPLYIASLKGHLDVVRLLVTNFMQRRIAWHKLRYGDGWTPLMAAAVANHYHVAQWLLVAAGADAARDLTTAANRYGQSALHIAARKGSLQMLQLLLCVGPGAVRMADASGETPLDVAMKHSHSAAVAEFRRVRAR